MGDFNGDGKLDLVMPSGNGTNVNICLGNGDGTFQSPDTYGVGARSVAVADLNGDGQPDIFTTNFNNSISVLLTNAAPTISSDLAAATGDKGSLATNSGIFDDVQGRNTTTLTASLGTVTRNDAVGTWNWTYTPSAITFGPTTVTITATDNGGQTATT